MRLMICSALVVLLTQGALAQFTLFAAETNSGSLGGDTAHYGGVQQYDFASTGGSFVAGGGLAAADLHDPVGLVVRNSKLYVSNRWGNTQGKGSVQDFDFDFGTKTLSGGATVAVQTTAASQGFHGFQFAPNGDLYVTTVSNGTHRYRDTGSGYTEIASVANGAVRDVWISPDGKKMITSGVGNALHITDIVGDGFGNSTDFTMSQANATHQMAFRGGSLYVTSFNSSKVIKVELDADYDPTSSSVLFDVSGAIGITFSPDGEEMFVSSHTGNFIQRYLDNGGTWTDNGKFDTGHNMGYLAAVPEPASMSVLGLGALALLRRRKKA